MRFQSTREARSILGLPTRSKGEGRKACDRSRCMGADCGASPTGEKADSDATTPKIAVGEEDASPIPLASQRPMRTSYCQEVQPGAGQPRTRLGLDGKVSLRERSPIREPHPNTPPSTATKRRTRRQPPTAQEGVEWSDACMTSIGHRALWVTSVTSHGRRAEVGRSVQARPTALRPYPHIGDASRHWATRVLGHAECRLRQPASRDQVGAEAVLLKKRSASPGWCCKRQARRRI